MYSEILTLLEETKFPTNKSRKNVSDSKLNCFVLGDVAYRRYINGKLIGPSRHTKKYPQLFEKLNEFIKEVDPDFQFTSIQVNKNVLCKPHIDDNNAGLSYIIGLGDYTDGELVIESEKYDIKNKWKLFDGHKLHWTEPFTGNRYSLIYFVHSHSSKKSCKI